MSPHQTTTGNEARARRLAVWLAVALLPAALLAIRLAVPLYYKMPEGTMSWPVRAPVLYLLPVLAAIVAVIADRQGMRRVAGLPWAWVVFACLAADLVVFTIGAYTESSLKLAAASALPLLGSMGSVLVGIFLWRWRPASVDGLIAGSVVIDALAGALAFSHRAGLENPAGRLLVAWDQYLVDELGGYLDIARAQGLELNPNAYSPMAVVGVLWALFGMKRGGLRTLTLAASVVISVLSQSRTAMLVIACLLVVSALSEWNARRPSHTRSHLLTLLAIAAALVIGLLGVRYGPVTVTQQGLTEKSETIEITPAATDPGIAGRLDAWRDAAQSAARTPTGLFQRYREATEPLPHAHNDILFRMVYAGPLWAIVPAIFLVWLAVWLKSRSHPWTGVAIAVTLLVNGITEPLSMMRPYTVLLFVIIGAMMWAKAAETEAA